MNSQQKSPHKSIDHKEKREQQNESSIQSHSQYNVSTLTFKIKDSLYLGTSIEAFKDQQFILLNWVENVIVVQTSEDKFDNSLKQLYGQEGDEKNSDDDEQQECIKYLHCDRSLFQEKVVQDKYKERDNEESIKEKQFTQSFDEIVSFIQSSQQQGTSCMILAVCTHPKISNTSDIFAICTGYMMKRYKWSLYKSLEYMNFKHPNASISEESLRFLNRLQIQLIQNEAITYNWKQWRDEDEFTIRNTFVNGKQPVWGETQIMCNKNQTNGKLEMNKNKQIKNINSTSNSPVKSYQIKSILKDSIITSNQQKTLNNTQKPRAIIRLQSNTVILFNLNTQSTDTGISQQLSQSRRFTLKKTNFPEIITKKQMTSSFQTARSQRISLSVRNIVAKYRDQKNSSTSIQNISNAKKISVDNSFEISGKALSKKKSYYNFQACQRVNENKQPKQIQNDGIFKIVKKLKTQTDMQTFYKCEQQKISTLPDQNSQFLKNNYQGNNKTLTESLPCQPNNQLKDKNSWLQIITKKRSSNEMSLKKMRNFENSLRKNNKENESDLKNEQKENGHRVYIKEVKKSRNEQFSDRKKSTQERISSQSSLKKKDRNFIIQYDDFKQMLRKKQISIGNPTLQNTQSATKGQKNEQKNNKISSVIQKLKKDSLQNQMSMITSRASINEGKGSNKTINQKSIQIKWR